ncbi:CGNR zinc finger domain-containing protein [Amycolatopsis cihanbeyliensis]|uniref:CGNR zinc finger protein n=1 Tax=Amycolatopsis cihanbeyliensis TaxID=1128664 RepID=A0A542DEG9_AMYCI|nr:CGNR zinc finger domain-containing protein [Amycolatopsis cihanbeyliensis]TQJ01477.1 CGNR zinc finger protein [Amycolatopsis cihanbeyliensis]
MVNAEGHRQAAPGDLERVRELLNTWLVPNDTRVPADNLTEFCAAHGLGKAETSTIRALRRDLRAAIEQPAAADELISGWSARTAMRPVLEEGRLAFAHDGGPAGDLLATVLSAAADGRLRRLKACPDCRWVFYDHTRNGSKRWCLMYAGGPEGRACGTIAKVRRHRERSSGTS